MTDTHIKINNVTPRVQYTGNGSTTSFPYSFAIFDESDMVVYVGDNIITTGYTVTGAGQTEGGNVVFATAPADGTKITLLRDVPIERITDFQEGGTFRPKNINDEFDRQTAFMQQVQEKVDRTLILPPTTDIDPSQILGAVERIYTSIDNVDAVADDLTNVDAVAADLTNIDTVASDLTNIDAVAGDLANVDAVAGNQTNIDAVAGNATNINAVAGNQTNIDAVAGNATNINTVAANGTDIDTVATNVADVNTCATNIAAIQDAPNQAQAAADSAALAQQYGNDKINQTHISNCVTYIPQDIKVELNDGVLTLKAGSKIYFPNGSGVFDTYTVPTDTNFSYSGAQTSITSMLFLRADNKSIYLEGISACTSGTTEPSGNGTWYDTINNLIKRYVSGYQHNASFPLCTITHGTDYSGGHIKSIDEVYNGFGYIGSTLFILPNVTGLIPNGRNNDGTLNNIEYTTTEVMTRTITSSVEAAYTVMAVATTGIGLQNFYYNRQENHIYNSTGTLFTDRFVVGFVKFDSSSPYKVANFKTKSALMVADYNDAPTLASFGMPSNRYIDLTLGASGTTYTAPANGYFEFKKSSTAAGQNIQLENSTGNISIGIISYSNNSLRCFLPVKKGDTIKVLYSADGTTTAFRFVYAEGEV